MYPDSTDYVQAEEGKKCFTFRIVIGGLPAESAEASLEVLAGNYLAKGVLTYDVDFK